MLATVWQIFEYKVNEMTGIGNYVNMLKTYPAVLLINISVAYQRNIVLSAKYFHSTVRILHRFTSIPHVRIIDRLLKSRTYDIIWYIFRIRTWIFFRESMLFTKVLLQMHSLWIKAKRRLYCVVHSCSIISPGSISLLLRSA